MAGRFSHRNDSPPLHPLFSHWPVIADTSHLHFTALSVNKSLCWCTSIHELYLFLWTCRTAAHCALPISLFHLSPCTHTCRHVLAMNTQTLPCMFTSTQHSTETPALSDHASDQQATGLGFNGTFSPMARNSDLTPVSIQVFCTSAALPPFPLLPWPFIPKAVCLNTMKIKSLFKPPQAINQQRKRRRGWLWTPFIPESLGLLQWITFIYFH